MRKHEVPREPENDNQPERPSTWWLMVDIFGLLGSMASRLAQPWS